MFVSFVEPKRAGNSPPNAWIETDPGLSRCIVGRASLDRNQQVSCSIYIQRQVGIWMRFTVTVFDFSWLFFSETGVTLDSERDIVLSAVILSHYNISYYIREWCLVIR
nr:CFF_HP1_G0031330.mRNA.1.CDS.1 [Saccharomyces cerevisiae]